jgi:hypothetical protein
VNSASNCLACTLPFVLNGTSCGC